MTKIYWNIFLVLKFMSFLSLSVCLSVCLSVWLSIYLCIYLSTYLYVCLSVCLSACLSFCLSSICLPACLPACLPVCLLFYLSICLSVCLSIFLYGIHHWRILCSNYRKLSWLGFQSGTTEFCSETLVPWDIRPWVQLASRANFVQLLQFHFSLIAQISFWLLPCSCHVYFNPNFAQVITQVSL